MGPLLSCPWLFFQVAAGLEFFGLFQPLEKRRELCSSLQQYER